MCGIHLIIDKTRMLNAGPIQKMAQALHYRGPDALHTKEICTATQQVFIGQNRLRITDIRPLADKLFQSADGRYTLAYNGEIYNHRELRKSLESKYIFETHSDTEVLLNLLIEEGEKCLHKLNGMFAFIWYDRAEEKLLICRDRFGMKPLYYAENDRYLVVSSELTGILASGLIHKALNKGQIPYYLQFKFAERPATFYKAIWEVMPGRPYSALPGKPLTAMETFTRQTPQIPVDQLTTQNILRQTENTLIAAINRHLPQEVPAGLFLSGGADSTLLLALAKESGIHMPVFSIAHTPGDSTFGTLDYQYARMAAKQFGAEHQEFTISSDITENFDDFINRTDQPVADSAAWLTYLLARQARPYVKVIFSGAGADELFAGYNRHWAYFQYLRHYKWLIKLLPVLKKTGLPISTGKHYLFRKQLRLLHKLMVQLSPSPEQTFSNFTAHLSFSDSPPQEKPVSEKLTNELIDYYLTKALIHDQKNYLPADVLTITDRMTMQASIEARLPYLDAELVSLVKSLPASYLLQYGRKWIVKEILAGKGGRAYAQRAKEGFGIPFGNWLHTSKGRYFIELITNRQSALYQAVPYGQVRQLLQAHLSGKRDYTSELWAVCVLAAWLKKELS